jgi:LPXTG-site transpeptidase (sortase) family protein
MAIFSERSRREWAWWGITALALGVGATALMSTLPTGVPTSLVLSPASATVIPAKDAPLIPAVSSSPPVHLTIPAIDIDSPVGTLGLQPDHELMVPTSTHVVDWYIDGPTPGSVGSSVILGHVDSVAGPGTFFNLKDLTTGDAITVDLANGTVTNFVVTRVMEYAKTSFPDRLVFGNQGARSLNLVTCGGVFDHDTGHYESNVVVFSQLVSVVVPPPGAST